MSAESSKLPPNLQYRALMTNIRARYEVVESLKLVQDSPFAHHETAAFHLRKSIEGVAFGCLVAMEQGLKSVPRDARGQWNADNIFARLKKRDPLVFPESFLRQDPPAGSPPGLNHHIVKNDAANISIDDIRDIYRRTHKWLHEWNPYVEQLANDYEKSKAELMLDLRRVWNWLVQHMIGIGGHIFLGILKDAADDAVRVVAAESSPLKGSF